MLFAMNELAGLRTSSPCPATRSVSVDLVESILDEAAKFATEVLDPINPVGDRRATSLEGRRGHHRRRLQGSLCSFCETGWNGMPASTEFGGQGLPVTVSHRRAGNVEIGQHPSRCARC
jgi:alkylation response protein AidB-like acyl-CoA dehydrogenase